MFYSWSHAIFGTDDYFGELRNAICDYLENNNTDNLITENKEDYIKNMRKNWTFGGAIEIHVYSIISKLKINFFSRTLQKINQFKAKDGDPIRKDIH